jgi:uncharacterized membrane protein
MNVKRWLLAGLVGFVVMFILSGLWYMLIMGGFYQEYSGAVMREQFNFIPIVLGYLVMAFLMSYIYPIGYKGGPPLKEGVRFGVFIGLLVWLSSNLILYGAHNMTLSATLVDSGWHVIEEGIGGIVIALVHGTASTGSSS